MPLISVSLERAIELNGEAVAMNRDAFRGAARWWWIPELARGAAPEGDAAPAHTLSAGLDE